MPPSPRVRVRVRGSEAGRGGGEGRGGSNNDVIENNPTPASPWASPFSSPPAPCTAAASSSSSSTHRVRRSSGRGLLWRQLSRLNHWERCMPRGERERVTSHGSRRREDATRAPSRGAGLLSGRAARSREFRARRAPSLARAA